ncbi:Hypothetical predicted protein [Marmota monax]|uniref:Uncharacterized protein n=2 Tax=Marmota monax TaxID=9995 RepID=A0A5E4AKA1_MARMO|nr:hypothetical protein GHT09_004390 [Marmota monax]VTJ57181.1 Hypothetical predicted protein [Marmota monax]
MSKPRAVEAAAAAAAVAVAATAPGPEMVERRGPGRPRTNGENVFAGQSKIYTYMSPNKCSGMRSPLQEENSVAHHEVKCQGKPLAGIYRKREEKRSAGNAIRSSLKSEEQKIKDARRGPLAPFPNQKSEAAEPPKTPTSTCDSTNAAVAKQALKKPLKGKQTPRKKAQGKTQQNRKLTDFYPVRRSSRKSKAELQVELGGVAPRAWASCCHLGPGLLSLWSWFCPPCSRGHQELAGVIGGCSWEASVKKLNLYHRAQKARCSCQGGFSRTLAEPFGAGIVGKATSSFRGLPYL